MEKTSGSAWPICGFFNMLPVYMYTYVVSQFRRGLAKKNAETEDSNTQIWCTENAIKSFGLQV